MLQWTCHGCAHVGPLETFYVKRDDVWDYECPRCATRDNVHLQIPRIDVTDRRLKTVVHFYIPNPKQVAMHVATERNILWGGRAGTGKSVGLRNDAYMRCLSVPHYRALLLRRQFTELQGTHLDKAAFEAERIGALWRASEKTMVFPNGSRLRFGHCENDDSVKQYLSEEYDIIYYDEGSTFTEYSWRFINSRLRTTKAGAVPMTRMGSNPGAMWVYRYYISQDVTPDHDPAYVKADYRYIPATITDNPHVNIQEQELRLNGLPSDALRKMYRDGDWNAIEGQFFTEWQPRHPETGQAWHVIKELPRYDGKPLAAVPWIKVVRAIDWGYDPDEGVCTWFYLLPDGTYLAFKEWTFKRTIAKLVADGIVERSRGMKVAYTVGGTDMWMTQGQTGESTAETFAKRKVSMQQANQDREQGWLRCHALLTETKDHGHGPYPVFRVYDHPDGCPNLARTIPMMQADPKKPGDLLQKSDHWVDTLRTFAMSRPAASRAPVANPWDRLPKEVRQALLRNSQRRLGTESVRRCA